MITACIISFIVGALIMMCAIGVLSNCKEEEPRNKVHFYITRDVNKEFTLWIGRPFLFVGIWIPTEKAYMIITSNNMTAFGLNMDDFENLKWNDKPVEVFLNLED